MKGQKMFPMTILEHALSEKNIFKPIVTSKK